ncbi:3-hydroxydecanoyl-ACP dehydratase [Gallaecimonas xiamenensis]|uniref:3-hydroxydecanoyl-ACP dehydratase n=1 Tax=Gallaecimonas xiamenensis 3-C-1 TaxID=745411 RepID=K2J192_9GAMM|nr:3-hydroxydecanoyl-ACP dehydratase [Gallaecimonas xiamenensis]EKE76666.1 3-hydroxydecanoyl-ACP dehydratase [Gallaecimonas xiamenensis 3-C-1]
MNPKPTFGPPDQYIAHRPPMALLQEVLEVGDDFARCRLVVDPQSPFATPEGVPSWVGIEYMAQTIAVYAGYLAEQAGEPVKPGFLLGTRRLEADFDFFYLGDWVEIEARRALMQEDGLSVFTCLIQTPKGQQKAQLTVYQPQDASAFLAGAQA